MLALPQHREDVQGRSIFLPQPPAVAAERGGQPPRRHQNTTKVQSTRPPTPTNAHGEDSHP